MTLRPADLPMAEEHELKAKSPEAEAGKITLAAPEEDFEEDEGEESYDDEVYEPDDADKLGVTIVTGFLGAGKTTLVNYILKDNSHKRKIMVIENEYGSISVDTDLVGENMKESENIITMENGCVCCTVRGDLIKTLTDLLDRRHEFDCILLETTGLADPSPIAATFNADPTIKDNYRIDSILCLVDAKHITQQLARKPEEGAVNEAAQQLAFADRVLLNKTDLVPKEELQKVGATINKINAFAEVIQTERSRAPLDKILGLSSFNLDRTLELLEEEEAKEEARVAAAAAAAAEKQKNEEQEKESKSHKGCGASCSDKNCHGHEASDGAKSSSGGSAGGCSHDHSHGDEGNSKRKADGQAHGAPSKKVKHHKKVVSTRHDSQVGSIGFTFPGSFDVDKFNKFMAVLMNEHSEDIYRCKGVLSFKDQAPKFVFQGVHEQVVCEPSSRMWEEEEDRHNKMVFIGRDLDVEWMEAGLRDTLVVESQKSLE